METYIKHILKPFDLTIWKVDVAFVLSSLITGITTFSQDYFGISGAFMLVLFVLLMTDFITGIAVAKNSNERLTSRKGLRTVYKAGAYLLFIYVAFHLHKEVEGKAELFETIIKYFHIYIIVHVSFWELFSIDENFKKLGVDLGITGLLRNGYTGVKNVFSRIGNPQPEEPSNEEELLD